MRTPGFIVRNLRRAMAAPERDHLTEEVEIDEFWLAGTRWG
jgi:hypothetical protein